MRRGTLSILILPAIIVSCLAQSVNFADNLQICIKGENFEEVGINNCLRSTLEELRGTMRSGLPELNLPPSEPLQIKNIEFSSKLAFVNVDSQFSSVTVVGLINFETRRIAADLINRKLFLDIFVPSLDIDGNYAIDGKVLFVPIGGKGTFTTKLQAVSGVGSANIVPVGPPGNQRLTIANTFLDFDVKAVQVQMNNLFNGNSPELAKEVNKVLNTQSDLIINEVKPQLRERMTQLVEKVMNDAFSKINANDFILSIEEKRASSSGIGSGSSVPIPSPARQRRGRFLSELRKLPILG
ncbi:protein takeout-like [Tigriopus californicus]|uniref:protein takeout-like n=1 Tax=Tigriopus californicus TaxID=6832 RepID=UPI0027DA4ACF|nr:protein takeout-like [Tigriopus californicus]